MGITIVCAGTFTPDKVMCWSRLRKDNPLLQSPLFCPEYAWVVRSVHGDVYVGILREDGHVVGFFPFQRTAKQIGRAACSSMTNCHGIIVEPARQFNIREVLRGCRLSIGGFDCVPRTQKEFEPYHQIDLGSPVPSDAHAVRVILAVAAIRVGSWT
jgi:hypothetical protein